MKHSLYLSAPWISQYYHGDKDDETKQTFGSVRDLYKVWLAEADDEIIKILSGNEERNIFKRFGLVFKLLLYIDLKYD